MPAGIIYTRRSNLRNPSRVHGTSGHCLAHAGKLNAYHLVISMPCTCRWQATNFVEFCGRRPHKRTPTTDYRVGSQFTIYAYNDPRYPSRCITSTFAVDHPRELLSLRIARSSFQWSLLAPQGSKPLQTHIPNGLGQR